MTPKKDAAPATVAFHGLIEPDGGGASFTAKVTAYAPAEPSDIPPNSPGLPPPTDWGPGGPPHPAFPIWGGPGSNFPDRPGYPPVVGGGPIIPPPPEHPNIPEHPVWGPPGIHWPGGPGYPPWAGNELPVPPIIIVDPPTGLDLPKPSHPINLPPPGQPPPGTYWALVYVYTVGWIWVLLPSGPTAGGASSPRR
jgi:hypothetical protein